ncbi:uncharacterized protein LOC133318434 [Gastrolobium bilobum]|uniref:uncharacterized protein LOC133318434 n=1 Tax=Gastrolobium bilobum TaxID=150636 RepID=UPI002AB0A11D|nr:uncharacterized protein LOC133318434 [Gastrolobium bilobum]
MLSGAGLVAEFWAEAVATACYLKNRSPTSALKEKILYEALFGKRTDVSHIRVFGSEAYVHVPKERRSKFDSKYEKCIFIGYKDGVKGATNCGVRCGLKKDAINSQVGVESSNSKVAEHNEVEDEDSETEAEVEAPMLRRSTRKQDHLRGDDLITVRAVALENSDVASKMSSAACLIKRERDKGRLWLSQRKYIEDVLKKFKMTDCKLVLTPMSIDSKL